MLRPDGVGPPNDRPKAGSEGSWTKPSATPADRRMD